ncbi:MAG: hypothetical protein AB1744_00910 [Candidatus Zixiibacteriota bacterium]
MEEIIGRDYNRNIKQLGVIAADDASPGLLVSRPALSNFDVFRELYTGTATALGAYTLDSPPFPVGYMYHMTFAMVRYYNGAISFIQLNFWCNNWLTLLRNNAPAFGVPNTIATPVILLPGDYVRLWSNVTTMTPNFELVLFYYRTPNP